MHNAGRKSVTLQNIGPERLLGGGFVREVEASAFIRAISVADII